MEIYKKADFFIFILQHRLSCLKYLNMEINTKNVCTVDSSFLSLQRERERERDQLKRVGGFDSELSIYSSYHNLQSPIYGNISKRSTLGPLLLLTFSR